MSCANKIKLRHMNRIEKDSVTTESITMPGQRSSGACAESDDIGQWQARAAATHALRVTTSGK